MDTFLKKSPPGRLKDAENKFLESLELNPDQPMTYNNLGNNNN